MKKLLILFSHKLTEDQINDSINKLGIEKFVYLPENLQTIWSNVNPHSDDMSELNKIFNFINFELKVGDYALIQGEWGYVYNTINFTKSLGIIPIYASTERIVNEIYKENGTIEKISLFKHVKFKKY